MKKVFHLMLIMLMVGVVSAQPMKQGMKHGKGCKIEDIIKDLTPEQKAKLKEIAMDMKTKSEPLREKLRQQKEELRTLIDNPSTSETVINNKIEEIGALKTELEKIRFDNKRRCDAVLTKSQQEFLKTQIEAKRSEMKGRDME